MSDFLLDLRPQHCRRLNRAAQQLCFVDDIRVLVIDRPAFGLVITQTGDPALWAPYSADYAPLVAIAGRLAFDKADWEIANTVKGEGGQAAKVIYSRYQKVGAAAFDRLNGNCVVIVCDEARRLVHLVTDCCGVLPAFTVEASGARLFGSHPDVLADVANESHRIDEISLAEFILSGTVTPPFSYYERIRAVDYGSIVTLDIDGQGQREPLKRRYFDVSYRGHTRVSEADLAGQLATALRKAVERRTLPRLGPTAVALSGGLDSRVLLSAAPDKQRTLAFTIYDEPNQELRTAEAIARSLAVKFLPLQRTPDYYADHAELGVRVSGGMGSFANNHFLGVIPRLKAEGIENLLTGCYCDYLFKALPLNRRFHWLTRREELAPFRHEFYFDHFSASTALAEKARERWESRVPSSLREPSTPAAALQLEARRTFPLCYEGDNQQRVVPQRVTGWCPPFVDRDLLEVYCRIPYCYKLNRSIVRKVALAVAPELRAIRDTNTGAAIDASAASEWLRDWQLRLQRKWRRLYTPAASDESWRNWRHYVLHSPKLNTLWRRPNPDAMDLFRRILGTATLSDDGDALKRRQPYLFLSLFTQKLWLDQRA